jgi:hypothetical protein
MKVGDVYNLDGSLIKLIMFDSNEVFQDELTEDNKLKYTQGKTVFYSRTPRDYFDKNTEFIKRSEFTTNELEIHRPDLPLRVNCFKELFWSHEHFENIETFNAFLKSHKISENKLTTLNTNKVVIYPTGQQQSLKKPILLENTNGRFSGLELLFQCFKIQQEFVKIEKPYFSRYRLIRVGREEKRLTGIGLYRLGIKGNIPSFYIGGYMSFMELEYADNLIV